MESTVETGRLLTVLPIFTPKTKPSVRRIGRRANGGCWVPSIRKNRRGARLGGGGKVAAVGSLGALRAVKEGVRSHPADSLPPFGRLYENFFGEVNGLGQGGGK